MLSRTLTPSGLNPSMNLTHSSLNTRSITTQEALVKFNDMKQSVMVEQAKFNNIHNQFKLKVGYFTGLKTTVINDNNQISKALQLCNCADLDNKTKKIAGRNTFNDLAYTYSYYANKSSGTVVFENHLIYTSACCLTCVGAIGLGLFPTIGLTVLGAWKHNSWRAEMLQKQVNKVMETE